MNIFKYMLACLCGLLSLGIHPGTWALDSVNQGPHLKILGDNLQAGDEKALVEAIGDIDTQHLKIHGDLQARDERTLVGIIEDINAQRLQSARDKLQQLVKANPKFKLAQLVYADLLQARTRTITGFGTYPDAPKETLANLLDEARVRLAHYWSPTGIGRIPASFIHMDPVYKYGLLVDLTRYRLYVVKNASDHPRVVADYYISMGKKGAVKHKRGDQRTPVGVYHITSQLQANRLPDLYGSGALPINYPNEWDKRLAKTGYGIWLHGTPSNTFARAPRASDGCVALSNINFTDLTKFVQVSRTPVVITNQAKWLQPEVWAQQQTRFKQLIENWRKDWQSLDSGRYLAHYSREFQARKKDYTAWVKHKKRVNSTKSYIRVGLSDISLFHYPDAPKIFVATFRQAYESSNHGSLSTKRQYWQQEADGRWRIIYEGPA